MMLNDVRYGSTPIDNLIKAAEVFDTFTTIFADLGLGQHDVNKDFFIIKGISSVTDNIELDLCQLNDKSLRVKAENKDKRKEVNVFVEGYPATATKIRVLESWAIVNEIDIRFTGPQALRPTLDWVLNEFCIWLLL